MAVNIENLTIKKAHQHLSVGDFSVGELVESYIRKIEKENPKLNAFLEVFDDLMEQAKKAQELFNKKQASVLTGIPLAIKDNILIKGKICSAGSKILENFKAVYDATVISKLKEHSPVFMGRTNMDEFAMGSSTENSAFGPTKNPHDLTRVPGGSSGGSAVAVAAGLSLASLGSETNGSVIQPSSFCGCVGLKPTYGAVSRFGLIAMGSSLDQIGVFSKSIEDARILFNVIKGKDPKDSTTIEDPIHPTVTGNIKLGIIKDLDKQKVIDKEITENFGRSVERFKKLGFQIKEISLPHSHYALAVYYIIMPAEVSSNLARYDGVKYGFLKEGDNLLEDYLRTRTTGFGREARRRILLGAYVLSAGYYDAYYNKANALRRLIISDFEKVFSQESSERVDAIISPTTPFQAFKLNEKISDPLAMYMTDVLTAPAAVTGLPAISIPAGFSRNKLPIGIQIIAPYLKEDLLFKVGKDFLGEID
jgi:aspartyl-tRNA(Asn)/glutamyl-tRNA(Gln) amidotransferase subunit A